jgi:hypothetical protein
VAVQCWRSAGIVRAAAVVLPVSAPLALPEVAMALLADDPVVAEATPLEEPVAVDDVEAGEVVAAVDVAEVGDADVVDDAGEVVGAADDTGDVVTADVATEAALVAEPALLLEAALPLLPQPESAKMRTSDVQYRRRRSMGLLLCGPRSAENDGSTKHAKRNRFPRRGRSLTARRGWVTLRNIWTSLPFLLAWRRMPARLPRANASTTVSLRPRCCSASIG